MNAPTMYGLAPVTVSQMMMITGRSALAVTLMETVTRGRFVRVGLALRVLFFSLATGAAPSVGFGIDLCLVGALQDRRPTGAGG